MLAYHNDQSIKKKYLDRVLAHQKADEIVKGIYWENGRGCAVGCTIHGSNHSKYEKELGIPIFLARLEDVIFENLPNDRAKIWPHEFLEAINVGADLSEVWPRFALWLLDDEKYGVKRFAKSEEQVDAINTIINYYKDYKNITKEQWYTADAAASEAAYASADAAASEAASEAYADAAYAAAFSAAASAAASEAAYASADAAYAAAVSAAASEAAYEAYADAVSASADAVSAAASANVYAYSHANRSNVTIAQADKLLEILRDTNVHND